MSDAVDGLLGDVDRYGRLTVSLNGLQIFGEAVRGRACGSCTACCTQVPVALPDEHKPANVRCKHLRSKGCGIYANRPRPCVAWSCRWLFDEDTAELRRPDQAGYVIDCAPDTVLATDEETGKQHDGHRPLVGRRRAGADAAQHEHVRRVDRASKLACLD
jgi:hypothetical protein